ncbi:MAG: hypothetical protein ACK4K0_01625 [Flavobacteriales bacterium]
MSKEQLYENVKEACASGSPGVGKRVTLLEEFRKNGLNPRDLDEMIGRALSELPTKEKEPKNAGYTTSAPFVGHASIEMPKRVEVKACDITIETESITYHSEKIEIPDVPKNTENVLEEVPFELTNDPVVEEIKLNYEVGKNPDFKFDPITGEERKKPESEQKKQRQQKTKTNDAGFSEEEIRKSKEKLEEVKRKIANNSEDIPNHPNSPWIYNLGLAALICSFVLPTVAFIAAIIAFILRNSVKNYRGETPYNTNNVLVRIGFIFAIVAVVITSLRNIFLIPF